MISVDITQNPVIQEEPTGCGIAAVANILGKSYPEMKAIANAMGIYASDQSLWSDTQHVRRMLAKAGVATSATETPFESWDALPNLALLAIKHHSIDDKNFWHWVVLSEQKENCLFSILQVIYHPTFDKILMLCSRSGLLELLIGQKYMRGYYRVNLL